MFFRSPAALFRGVIAMNMLHCFLLNFMLFPLKTDKNLQIPGLVKNKSYGKMQKSGLRVSQRKHGGHPFVWDHFSLFRIILTNFTISYHRTETAEMPATSKSRPMASGASFRTPFNGE